VYGGEGPNFFFERDYRYKMDPATGSWSQEYVTSASDPDDIYPDTHAWQNGAHLGSVFGYAWCPLGYSKTWETYRQNTMFSDPARGARFYDPGAANVPSARGEVAMAFDSGRGVLVAFGGDVGARGGAGWSPAAIDETWEYDPTANSWSQKTPATVPPPRLGAAMVYDTVNGVCIMHGGWQKTLAADVVLDDTWAWDGTDWTLLSASGPGPRFHHGMVFDPGEGVSLVFGGENPWKTYLQDTWTLALTTYNSRLHAPVITTSQRGRHPVGAVAGGIQRY